MKFVLFSILVFLLEGRNCAAFPFPIPEPNCSSEAATALAMKAFSKDAKDWAPRSRDEAFAQSIIYTNYELSKELQEWVQLSGEETIKSSVESWLLNEWGWLITVVRGHDLSHKTTYFVRPSGAVELLWHTD